MRQLKSANQYGNSESFGDSIFVACCGSISIVLGLALGLSAGGFFGGNSGSLAYALAFFAFGIMVTGGALYQAKLSRRFGESEASITEDVIRRGESFHFLYQQQCRQMIDINSIDLFFVFREKVHYYDGEPKTKYVDRIIQRFRSRGRIYSPGDFIREEAIFQVPTRPMGIRNPFMKFRDAKVQTMWVVKAHLDLPKKVPIWQEYEVEVLDEVAKGHFEMQKQSGCFDVFFTGSSLLANPLRITKVMDDLLPHLDAGQIGDLYYAHPCLILERVTEAEAQTAKALFEAVNAKAEIKPSEVE